MLRIALQAGNSAAMFLNLNQNQVLVVRAIQLDLLFLVVHTQAKVDLVILVHHFAQNLEATALAGQVVEAGEGEVEEVSLVGIELMFLVLLKREYM
jgi:hypothetical protein